MINEGQGAVSLVSTYMHMLHAQSYISWTQDQGQCAGRHGKTQGYCMYRYPPTIRHTLLLLLATLPGYSMRSVIDQCLIDCVQPNKNWIKGTKFRTVIIIILVKEIIYVMVLLW